MELEQDYERKRGSGNGTETAYMVEARYTTDYPIQIGGQLFDNRWREVKFQESLIGVPRCANYQKQTIEHNLLGFSAAQALRWWLHAVADAEGIGGLCLETRIVSYRITYSYNIEAIEALDCVNNIMEKEKQK